MFEQALVAADWEPECPAQGNVTSFFHNYMGQFYLSKSNATLALRDFATGEE